MPLDERLRHELKGLPDAGPLDLDAGLRAVHGSARSLKHRRRAGLVAVLAVLVLASAVGLERSGGGRRPTASPLTTQLVRADVARARPSVPPQIEARVVEADTAFALDLYRHLPKGDDDLFFSPYSIAAALTMTYVGAKGNTAEQMRRALHLSVPDRDAHAARNALDHLLTARHARPGEKGQPLTLRTANALWGQTGYPFQDSFLKTLAASYGAGMNLVDFERHAEGSRLAINRWVEQQTKNRVKAMLKPGVLDDATRLVLVNAIYFKGSWQVPFTGVANGPFTTLAGSHVAVPMMRLDAKLQYGAGDGYEAVRLPYVGGASMVVIAPTAGRFTDVERELDPGMLRRIITGLSLYQLDLRLPKFQATSELRLTPTLEALGVRDAFDPSHADFSGMTPRRELFVKDVVQKAFVNVDEKGTEAAAATAVSLSASSGARSATLHVDRPFLFLVQDDATGSVLFMGRVTDPR